MPEQLNPEDMPICHTLREVGALKDLPYTSVQKIRDVASAEIIALVMTKLDAQNARLDARKAKLDAISDAQQSRLRMLMWMIGAAVALIGIFVRLWI